MVLAALYLSAKKEQGFCPNLLKADCGSENGDIAVVHCLLTGINLSHRYCASHANQRIENWWLNFTLHRRLVFCLGYSYFKKLVHDCIFVPSNFVHMECI